MSCIEMEKQSHLEIDQRQFELFMKLPADEKVVMLNLLKYKSHVPETGLSGKDSYREYMRKAMPFFKKANARVLFFGTPRHMLIGPEDAKLWDEVLLIEYATLSDFLGMVRAEGYPSQARALALSDSRLIHCTPN